MSFNRLVEPMPSKLFVAVCGPAFPARPLCPPRFPGLRPFLPGPRYPLPPPPRPPASPAPALFFRPACVCAPVPRAALPALPPGSVLFPAFFCSAPGARGRPFLRGRAALPAPPAPRFSARSGLGFVAGRPSRSGKSPDASPHDSPAIRIVN